jgi:Flp pilus assembly secretin CpaC
MERRLLCFVAAAVLGCRAPDITETSPVERRAPARGSEVGLEGPEARASGTESVGSAPSPVLPSSAPRAEKAEEIERSERSARSSERSERVTAALADARRRREAAAAAVRELPGEEPEGSPARDGDRGEEAVPAAGPGGGTGGGAGGRSGGPEESAGPPLTAEGEEVRARARDLLAQALERREKDEEAPGPYGSALPGGGGASPAALPASPLPSPPVLRSGAEAPAPAGAAPQGTVAPEETAPEETAPPAVGAPAAAPESPKGIITLKEMHHKSSDELMVFLRDHFPEWVRSRQVAKIEGKGRSVMIFGETPAEPDPLTEKIAGVIDHFDDLELKIEQRVIRPRYIDVRIVMDSLAMRGLANVWQIAEETLTATVQIDPKTTRQAVHKHDVFTKTGLTYTEEGPVPMPPSVPYVYEIPTKDPFAVPLNYQAPNDLNHVLVNFNASSSTEQRGGIVAVGTAEDLERIEAFVENLDVPAKRIMIEVQVIQLDASKFIDIGFDSAQFGEGHQLANLALPFPGEGIRQPGIPEARGTKVVPPVTQEGFQFLFDDTSLDLSGRFLTTLHALVREGDAKVMARPRILTLDDRVSVLHLGRDLPTFKSTGVVRDATEGNLVNEINEVGTVYVGFTLNMRPRVTGGEEDEVSLQIELIVNELEERERVFEEDLLGIPRTLRRQFIGQNRVKNHRPIVLGGLIQETEVDSVNKIPLLGDIPLLGYLFRRSQKTRARSEIVLVVTPHILSDSGVDRIATPKESALFDTFDSVLFNDLHIIKGRDVLGVDPITGYPAQSEGKIFTEEEVIDLTLLNIIKERELVSKLKIFDDYLSDEASDKLSWIQRRWPERTVKTWNEEMQEVYFRAAAIVLENIKELNPDLTYEEIVTPRREIVLPTTPYRISLTYDRVKSLQAAAAPLILRSERVDLDEETVKLMRDTSGRSLRDFGRFLETRSRNAEDHGEVLAELKRLYLGQYPTSQELEGLSYSETYSVLAREKFDFVSLATYFQENLADRYRVVGPPDAGALKADLRAFVETSVSLHDRARQLRDLEKKWDLLQEPPLAEAGTP